MAGIEHDGLDLLRFLDPARAQNRLDDFAHVHHRDQVFVAAIQEREVRQEPDAVDGNLARAGLGADRPVLAPQ